MSNEFPTLNGVAPSWADIEGPSFIIQGGPTIKTPDIAAIKWEESIEVGAVRGTNGGRKTKRTSGQGDCSAGITFYLDGWKIIRDALAAVATLKNLSGYGKVPFDVVFQYTPPGDDAAIHTLKIVAARVVKVSGNPQEGADADKIETDLNIMRVEQDGVSII
jgi:hypothetical protein